MFGGVFDPPIKVTRMEEYAKPKIPPRKRQDVEGEDRGEQSPVSQDAVTTSADVATLVGVICASSLIPPAHASKLPERTP